MGIRDQQRGSSFEDAKAAALGTQQTICFLLGKGDIMSLDPGNKI